MPTCQSPQGFQCVPQFGNWLWSCGSPARCTPQISYSGPATRSLKVPGIHTCIQGWEALPSEDLERILSDVTAESASLDGNPRWARGFGAIISVQTQVLLPAHLHLLSQTLFNCITQSQFEKCPLAPVPWIPGLVRGTSPLHLPLVSV